MDYTRWSHHLSRAVAILSNVIERIQVSYVRLTPPAVSHSRLAAPVDHKFPFATDHQAEERVLARRPLHLPLTLSHPAVAVTFDYFLDLVLSSFSQPKKYCDNLCVSMDYDETKRCEY